MCAVDMNSHVKDLSASALQERQSLPSPKFRAWQSLPWFECELIICTENVQSRFLSLNIHTLKDCFSSESVPVKMCSICILLLLSLYSCSYVCMPVHLQIINMPSFPGQTASPSESPVPPPQNSFV